MRCDVAGTGPSSTRQMATSGGFRPFVEVWWTRGHLSEPVPSITRLADPDRVYLVSHMVLRIAGSPHLHPYSVPRKLRLRRRRLGTDVFDVFHSWSQRYLHLGGRPVAEYVE